MDLYQRYASTYYGQAVAATSSQKRKGEEAPGDETSPTTEKLTGPPSTPPKPKKHKISDNEHSHGSFFLRIGAIGQLVPLYPLGHGPKFIHVFSSMNVQYSFALYFFAAMLIILFCIQSN